MLRRYTRDRPPCGSLLVPHHLRVRGRERRRGCFRAARNSTSPLQLQCSRCEEFLPEALERERLMRQPLLPGRRRQQISSSETLSKNSSNPYDGETRATSRIATVRNL